MDASQRVSPDCLVLPIQVGMLRIVHIGLPRKDSVDVGTVWLIGNIDITTLVGIAAADSEADMNS